jgi:hypothetical protein
LREASVVSQENVGLVRITYEALAESDADVARPVEAA